MSSRDVKLLVRDTGANINYDENDNYRSVMDAGMLVQLVEALAKAQGHGKTRYITNAGSHATIS